MEQHDIMENKILNIGVVGCGAIVENLHLPLLEKRKDCEVAGIADKNGERANYLGKKYKIKNIYRRYEELFDLNIDGVLIAVPNCLHSTVSIDFLKRKIPVLVEKPMAISVDECKKMIEISKKEKVILSVGHHMRYSAANIFTKWAIDNRLLDDITSVDCKWGFVFDWPVKSESFLNKSFSGGGVLIDLGVHLLDILMWWFGEVSTIEYKDDSYGGVEADCQLELIFKNKTKCFIELSRTRDLRNTCIVNGEKASLEIDMQSNSYHLVFNPDNINLSGYINIPGLPISNRQRLSELILAEHENFINSIKKLDTLVVSGEMAQRSIELIEKCYKNKKLLKQAWIDV